jgi:hypothetical protein
MCTSGNRNEWCKSKIKRNISETSMKYIEISMGHFNNSHLKIKIRITLRLAVTANQFVLAPNPSRITTRVFFWQLKPYGLMDKQNLPFVSSFYALRVLNFVVYFIVLLVPTVWSVER